MKYFWTKPPEQSRGGIWMAHRNDKPDHIWFYSRSREELESWLEDDSKTKPKECQDITGSKK
jgi:hypothetical protein